MKEKIISIQIKLYFGKLAAAVHRNGKTRIYHGLTQSSWWRVMDTGRIARSQREITKGREYQFYYL